MANLRMVVVKGSGKYSESKNTLMREGADPPLQILAVRVVVPHFDRDQEPFDVDDLSLLAAEELTVRS
jgi:hypothetical protein